MILDRNIKYKYRRHYVSANQFSSLGAVDGAADDLENTKDATQHLNDIHATPVGVTGWQMTAAGKAIVHGHPVYKHWDWDNDIYVRAVWASKSTTDTDTIDWIVTYELTAWDEAPAATINDALDTAIAQDTDCGVASALQATAWGKIVGETVDPDTKDWIMWQIEMDALDASEDTFLVGLEIAYVPKNTEGAQIMFEAAPTDD